MKIKLPRLGRGEIAILLLVIAALVFLLWVYFFWLVVEEEEFNIGPIKEARNNRLYAAQKFLEQKNINSDIAHSPKVFEEMRIKDQLIGDTDTVVLFDARGAINGERFENLWSWVEGGGTLVISTDSPFYRGEEGRDDLLLELGVFPDVFEDEENEFKEWSEDELPEEESSEEDLQEDSDQGQEYNKDEADSESAEDDVSLLEIVEEERKKNYFERNQHYCEIDNPAQLDVADEARPLQIAYGPVNYFYTVGEREPDLLTFHDYSYVFALYHVGEGRIAVNASNDIWHNQRIGCFDHAFLLQRLSSRSEQAWFVINREVPSLFNLVWKGIPMGVLAAFLLAVLLLWRALVRFGPVFPNETIERRSFAEHIRASADFYWRNGLQGELIEQLRKDISQLMGQRNPVFDELNPAEQLQALQKHCDLPLEELQRAFLDPVEQTPRKEFVLIVHRLKTIKEEL